MKRFGTFLAISISLLSAGAAPSSFASSATKLAAEQNEVGMPKKLADAGITEHLGGAVSVGSLAFKDETGKQVFLKDYFKPGKPVLLNLGYYGCPMLCGMVLNGLVDSLKKLEWTAGKEFELVTLSIDPAEGPELAAKKKTNYLQSYGRPVAAPGWHFLTGTEDQIKKLTQEVGFGYRYDAEEKQFAHSAALIVLTPEGKVSRYLYGIEYPEKDLKLALVEASDGKVGTVVDRLLLFCFQYDPKQKKYSMIVTRVMQTGGAGTLVIFGAYLALFWRRERRGRGV